MGPKKLGPKSFSSKKLKWKQHNINFIVLITKVNKVVRKPHRKGNVAVHRSSCRYNMVSRLNEYLVSHNSHIHKWIHNVFTGCVPSFHISIVEDEVRAKHSNCWDILLQFLKFDILFAKFVKFFQSIFVFSKKVSCMRPHFEWMHRHFVCMYVCTKMLVFFLSMFSKF